MPEKSKFSRFITTLKQPKFYIPLFIILILLILGVSVARMLGVGQSQQTATTRSSIFKLPLAQEKTVTSPLDGLQYTENIANRHALGVMIENHPDARPQYGLSSASVVYEAMAEGGITRFLAIYGPRIPEKVGPVRSVRTYYIDWCLEYDCFLAHVGGNIDALDEIPHVGIKDLDQFRYGVSKYGKTYYRQPHDGVATEHTMYADPAKLYDIAISNKWDQTGGFPTIEFKKEADVQNRGAAQTIDIEISSKQFNTSWAYDPAANSYARTMGGVAHKDGQTGEQIKSKVVIVQEAASHSILTRINEQGLAMDTVGTGKARIFQDGQDINGTWKKASQKAQTIFYDADGKVIEFNPGQRWVTIVNPGSKVTVTPAS